MSNLEIEIQQWLQKDLTLEEIAELVARYLERDLRKNKKENLDTACSFWILSGQYQSMITCLEKLPLSDWPWSALGEALADQTDLVLRGARQTGHSDALARAPALKTNKLEYADWKRLKSKKRQELHLKKKMSWLDELVTFRSQQLYESEKKLLKKLSLLFRSDPEIIELTKEHNRRYALEIVQKKINQKMTFWEPLIPKEQEDPTWSTFIKNSHLQLGNENPPLRKDLLISCLLLDLPEVAFELVQTWGLKLDHDWIIIEIFLQTRRYAEVIYLLQQIEMRRADDPDAFFATAYARALAFWGLGLKDKAVEVMEALLSSKPNYRSGEALLQQWRSY